MLVKEGWAILGFLEGGSVDGPKLKISELHRSLGATKAIMDVKLH
jgi:hypothetical protein